MILWIHPEHCKPPHAVTHPDKLEELIQAFALSGWNPDEPALIGYEFSEGIQLVSGSHRWAAAEQAGIKIPVELKTYEYMQQIWGTDEWLEMILNPPQAGMSDSYYTVINVKDDLDVQFTHSLWRKYYYGY